MIAKLPQRGDTFMGYAAEAVRQAAAEAVRQAGGDASLYTVYVDLSNAFESLETYEFWRVEGRAEIVRDAVDAYFTPRAATNDASGVMHASVYRYMRGVLDEAVRRDRAHGSRAYAK
jgi:hypothetical protein